MASTGAHLDLDRVAHSEREVRCRTEVLPIHEVVTGVLELHASRGPGARQIDADPDVQSAVTLSVRKWVNHEAPPRTRSRGSRRCRCAWRPRPPGRTPGLATISSADAAAAGTTPHSHRCETARRTTKNAMRVTRFEIAWLTWTNSVSIQRTGIRRTSKAPFSPMKPMYRSRSVLVGLRESKAHRSIHGSSRSTTRSWRSRQTRRKDGQQLGDGDQQYLVDSDARRADDREPDPFTEFGAIGRQDHGPPAPRYGHHPVLFIARSSFCRRSGHLQMSRWVSASAHHRCQDSSRQDQRADDSQGKDSLVKDARIEARRRPPPTTKRRNAHTRAPADIPPGLGGREIPGPAGPSLLGARQRPRSSPPPRDRHVDAVKRATEHPLPVTERRDRSPNPPACAWKQTWPAAVRLGTGVSSRNVRCVRARPPGPAYGLSI